MLIDAVQYGRKKIYRIYQGGELVWYLGDILSLYNDLLVGVGSVDDGRLTSIPLTLGNAENAHSIGLYSFNHGTTVGIVPFHHEQTHPVSCFHDADLDILRARLGNHSLDSIAYVGSDLSGRAYNAKLGNHFADRVVRIERHGTAVAAAGRLGNHFAAHLVEVDRMGTGIAAAARMGHHDSNLLAEAFYQSTGAVASAVMFSKMGGVRVEASYQGSGVGASARLMGYKKDLLVEAAYQNSGVPASAVTMGKMVDLRIDAFHEDAALAAETAVGNGIHSLQVVRENKLNGSAHTPVEFFHDQAEHCTISKEHHSVVASCLNGNSVYALDILVNEEVAADGVQLVSLAADNAVSCRERTEAHLSDNNAEPSTWLYPIQTDDGLYIRQVYEATQTDSDLSLGEYHWLAPVQTEDGLYIRQVYTAKQNGSNLVLHDLAWLAPIQSEDGLYIRQATSANKTGTDITVS